MSIGAAQLCRFMTKENIADMVITVLFSGYVEPQQTAKWRIGRYTGATKVEGGLQFVKEAYQETFNAKRHQND